MASSFNKSFFHAVDVETTGRSAGHRQTGLLQIYGTNLGHGVYSNQAPFEFSPSPYKGAIPWDPRTFVRPSPGYTDPRTGLFTPFTFNFEKGEPVLRAARKLGVSTEEEATRSFFEAASQFEKQRDVFRRNARNYWESVAQRGIKGREQATIGEVDAMIGMRQSRGRRFIFAGWNPEYDKSMLEEVAQRYPSLEQYRGFFKRPGVKVLGMEKPFLDLAFMYGQENPEFSKRYFRMAASTPFKPGVGPGLVPSSSEGMRYVSGWGLENVVHAAGGPERLIDTALGHHEAVADVRMEEQLYERSRLAKKLVGRGYSFDVAMRSAGLLPEGETAETFFTKVYASDWSKRVAQQAEKGIALKPPRPNTFAGAATKVLLVAAAAAAAYAIAHSKREDRQGTITGLNDIGVAPIMRHQLTDFGSGWQGEDNTSKRIAKRLLVGAAVFSAYKWATVQWSEGFYQLLKNIEERSPSELFRTFGLSQLQSSYLVDRVSLRPDQLFFGRELTETGKHIQRLTGLGPTEFQKGLQFRRMSKYSPYLELEGRPGVAVRFAERGRLTGSSARYGAELFEPLPWRTTSTSPLDEIREIFMQRHERQLPRTPLSKKSAFQFNVGGETRLYEPLFGRRAGLVGRARSFYETTERVAFEWAERPLRLLSNIGLGLEQGTYNKLFHIPGIGEGGLLNQLLLKRVLPAYAAITAARWINYKFGNKPAEVIVGAPLKLNVLRAEATDKIPGLRAITDKYEEIVPGPQYGPLALPVAGGVLSVALGHYLPLARGAVKYAARPARAAAARLAFRKGALIGGLAMLPFLPGMIGSRKTADELRRIYSGEEEVPIRAGRWWDVGSTPFRGGRIKYYRQHWYSLMQSKAETVATYGSEDAYWEHHPGLHPFKYIQDPYWLERANYASRPYPITSPAFSNVPLVGHLLAATVGRVVKPEIRMHEREWDINNYTLYSSRLEPNMALGGLPPSTPRTEYNLKDVAKREAISFAEFTGLPGFIATTLYGKYGPQGTPGKDVVLQGSRQMTNWSRQYYERELGAVSGFNPVDVAGMPFGYSEPLRRFIQPENNLKILAANEIPNTMPRWLPGEDYMVNFRTGDPFTKIPEGGARLPGPGYAALHPELAGVKPERYPDIARYKILADVAPYSKEYMIYRAKVRAQAQRDTRLAIEFARTEEQVRQVKESTISFDKRRFTLPTENITGTIRRATPQGVELEEYPGHKFTLSSLGMSAADLSAAALGEANADTIAAVEEKQTKLQEYFADLIGKQAQLVVPVGTQEHAAEARAVIFVNDTNINRQIINSGLGTFRKDQGGAEAQAMFTSVQQSLGRYAETLAFTGEGGPLRAIPTPFHTKYWNERTALSLYQEQEVYGSRMRRWQKPFHDMVAPWARGMYRRITGETLVPAEVEHRREMDSLVDQLDYLRGYVQASAHPQMKGRYTSQTKRTNIGANLFGSPGFIATTLPRREKLYFQAFLQETDPEKREQILQSVSPELSRALTSQWIKTDAMLAREMGKEVPPIEEGGILFTKKGLKDYAAAETSLSYGDFIRSQQVAQTFSKLGFEIPGPGSPLWSEGMDYEDVKLKIIQNEGYDYHDFNVYDDRANLLWRKPYIDGAVRELTAGGNTNAERLRQTVERIIVEGQDKNPRVMANAQSSATAGSNITITVDEQGDKDVMRDVRRNEDEYRSETSS